MSSNLGKNHPNIRQPGANPPKAQRRELQPRSNPTQTLTRSFAMIDPQFGELIFRYPRPAWPLETPEFLGGAGGYSGSRLWRYRSASGRLLLRAWPEHGPPHAHIEQVHRWLYLTTELGFTPVPIRDNSGRSVQEFQGRFWEIAPWLEGVPEQGQPPVLARLRAAFVALAAFHVRLACEQSRGVSPGLMMRRDSLRQLIHGGFDSLEPAIVARPASADGLRDLALLWLTRARALAHGVERRLGEVVSCVVPLQPCLRDVRPEHFLFEGDRVSGLVDFGAMGVESVAADLARLIAEWLEGDRLACQEALAAYQIVRSLDSDESNLIEVFESSAALLIGERWARWHFLEHRTFDDPRAVARGVAKSAARLERLAMARNPCLR
jgi:homoserine kinase type II